MTRCLARLQGRGVRLWVGGLFLVAAMLAVAPVTPVAADGSPPSFGHLTPPYGPAAGGTIVTITGTGFTHATAVVFGTTPATPFTVNSDTSITVTTPQHDPGAVPIGVTEAGGATVVVGGFYFLPAQPTPTPPTITSVTPNTGSTAGHTPVVVTGSGFRPGMSVTFGGTAATDVHVFADGVLTASTPAHAAGAVDVVVTNAGNQSATLAGGFTYVTPAPAPAPTITQINPNTAPASTLNAGSAAMENDDHHGTPVAITGTGFQAHAAVTFGGTPADYVYVISPTLILVTPPAHAAGVVDVTVTNPDDQSATLTGGFTYVAQAPAPAPTITKIDPNTGPTGDGTHTIVVITGTGFQDGATITFGTATAHDVGVISDTLLIALVPSSNTAGPVDVTVTNRDGQHATLKGGFTYVVPTPAPAPTITKIDPNTGPAGNGTQTTVTITGTGFQHRATVKFGSVSVPSSVFPDGTKLITVAPSEQAGKVDVTVTNPDNQSATVTGGFTYVTPTPGTLAITQVDPPVGPAEGGQRVTIRGSGFTSGMTVTFGTTAATNVEVVNNGAAIRATTPAHGAGIVNVTVSDGNGNTATLNGGYGYIAEPTNTNDRHTPGTANVTGGQPPSPIPTNDRHQPGSSSGTTSISPAGASGQSGPTVNPAPPSR